MVNLFFGNFIDTQVSLSAVIYPHMQTYVLGNTMAIQDNVGSHLISHDCQKKNNDSNLMHKKSDQDLSTSHMTVGTYSFLI